MVDVQFWIVVAMAAGAVAFLWRRYARVRKGLAPVCGNCDQCSCKSVDAA